MSILTLADLVVDATKPFTRCRRGVGDIVRMEYVSRVPRPPLDGLIDDLYYLQGASPYARLMLPPMPAALLIVNLGPPFLIRGGTDIETAEYVDFLQDRQLTKR